VECSLALTHGVLARRIFFISHILAMNIFLFKVYIFCQNLFMYMNDRIVMDVFNPVGVFLSEQSVVIWCYYPQRVSISAVVTWYGNSLSFSGRCINMSSEGEDQNTN